MNISDKSDGQSYEGTDLKKNKNYLKKNILVFLLPILQSFHVS